MTEKTASLGIGEIIVSAEPLIVSTVLGSCISVCIFSKTKGIGGIIHYALPDKSHANGSQRNDLHFGDLAIEALVRKLREAASDVNDWQAKLVGGGAVMETLKHASNIGQLNIQVAKKQLQRFKIPIVGEDVGGTKGRKIYFYTATGRLRVSHIDETIAKKEFKIELKVPKTKVLVIDDSKTIRDLLTKILNCDLIEVVGAASNPVEAEPMIKRLKPDVLTLDIHMPVMDGVTFLEKFMPSHPMPVVMITSISMEESSAVFRALELGAVDYIKKPDLKELASQTDIIREKIITASRVQISDKKPVTTAAPAKVVLNVLPTSHQQIIAIGASTGGTEALKAVLTRLPANIPPILIVQHIPPVFSAAFAKRLNELCAFEVKEAENGDEVRPGRVLVAPGDMQMAIEPGGKNYRVRVFDGEKVNRHKPSVDVLFDSVAEYVGEKAIGVILTGMGNDGAKGMKKMKEAGAYTIGQDEASCVVYGMPKVAFELKAVDHVVSLLKIPEALVKIIERKKVA